MIPPSELRIGNWVYDFDHNNQQVVKQVVHIDKQYVKLEKPIWLTEEWLNKFGFERQPSGAFIFHSYVIVPKELEKTFAFGIRFADHSITHIIEVKFVHQLQNLFFALTGKEL